MGFETPLAENSETERRVTFFNALQIRLIQELRKASGHGDENWYEKNEAILQRASTLFDAHGRLGTCEDDWSTLSLDDAYQAFSEMLALPTEEELNPLPKAA
jgi:hypothetical protein